MITGGRIQHHIRQNLQNPLCTILLVGYAVEGTIGHDLLTGKKHIQFKKHTIPVAAKIIYTDIFSSSRYKKAFQLEGFRFYLKVNSSLNYKVVSSCLLL